MAFPVVSMTGVLTLSKATLSKRIAMFPEDVWSVIGKLHFSIVASCRWKGSNPVHSVLWHQPEGYICIKDLD